MHNKTSAKIVIVAFSLVVCFSAFFSAQNMGISLGSKTVSHPNVPETSFANISKPTNSPLTNSINVGFNPDGIAYDPSNGYIYVANSNSHNISVINPATNRVIDSINVEPQPIYFAYDPSNGYMYVSNYFSANISVINSLTNSVINTIKVGSNPDGLAYDPSNGYIYVANLNSHNISVINPATNRVIDSINGFSVPLDVAYDPSNGYMYVSNYGANSVSLINTTSNSISNTIFNISSPDYVAYNPYNNYMYVTGGFYSNNVSVLNTTKIIDTIQVGVQPDALAYNPLDCYMYVANGGGDNISIINSSTNKVIDNINVGSSPDGIAYDPANHYMYITNSDSYNVSIIVPTTSPPTSIYNVTFTESGLPSGTTWYVNLSNGMDSGAITGTSYSFSLTNGTYSYTIATMDKTYEPSPSSGSLTVNGASVSKSVSFSEVKYTVTFNEKGLPSGEIWGVFVGHLIPYGNLVFFQLIGGNMTSNDSTTVSLSAGIYTWTVVSYSNQTSEYLGVQGPYVAIPISGNLSVSGNTTVSIQFAPEQPLWAFQGASANYTATIQKLTNNGPVNNSTANYSMAISYVNDNNTIVNYTFTSSLFAGYKNYTTFWNEFPLLTGDLLEYYSPLFLSMLSGNPPILPFGFATAWNVSKVNLHTSVGIFPVYNLTFFDADGFNYSVSIDAYSGVVLQMNLSNRTTNVIVSLCATNIPLSPLDYFETTFTESGLPSGTTWYVNLSNGMDSGAITGTSYSFSLTNGTYSYTIATMDKTYEPSPSSGSLTVNGASVSKSVSFSEVKYTVTFTESGLPSGTTWYVNMSGVNKSSTSSTIVFSEINNTYVFVIGSISNYTASQLSGTIAVNGSSIVETITFTAQNTINPHLSGFNSTDTAIIAGVIGVTVVGVVAAVFMRKRRS